MCHFFFHSRNHAAAAVLTGTTHIATKHGFVSLTVPIARFYHKIEVFGFNDLYEGAKVQMKWVTVKVNSWFHL